MPSVTKTALCTVDYCPAKNDPWWHVCVVCENNVIEHAHIIARSQAPERRNDPNNVVPLCHREHDLVSRHVWTFVEQALPFGGVHQWLRDDKGVTVWSRDIGASTGGPDEATGTATDSGKVLPRAPTSIPVSSGSPAGASGVPSAAAEVPDSGSGADALAVAPGASGVPSDGEEDGWVKRSPLGDGSMPTGDSPLSPGASRGLPEERVGRDSQAAAYPDSRIRIRRFTIEGIKGTLPGLVEGRAAQPLQRWRFSRLVGEGMSAFFETGDGRYWVRLPTGYESVMVKVVEMWLCEEQAKRAFVDWLGKEQA